MIFVECCRFLKKVENAVMTGYHPSLLKIMIRGLYTVDILYFHTTYPRRNKSECDFTCFFPDIVIVRHPVSVCVPVNHKVTLSVCAEGTGTLSYLWFTANLNEVCGAQLKIRGGEATKSPHFIISLILKMLFFSLSFLQHCHGCLAS